MAVKQEISHEILTISRQAKKIAELIRKLSNSQAGKDELSIKLKEAEQDRERAEIKAAQLKNTVVRERKEAREHS